LKKRRLNKLVNKDILKLIGFFTVIIILVVAVSGCIGNESLDNEGIKEK